MGVTWWVQIFVNLVLFIGLTVVWLRLRRPAQDDPRLSRGLQLLSSKIVVLEDLSDRTDAQVTQLTNLIDQKARLLQNKIIEAEHQMRRIEQSMNKSREVASIFQDKIPHEEIIERQNTIKYVKAAKMAHAGRTPEEIAAEVDLPIGQIEMIAKVNKENLVFDDQALPEWAKEITTTEVAAVGTAGEPMVASPTAAPNGPDMAQLFQPPAEEYSSLKRLGAEFRMACLEFDQRQAELSPTADAGSQATANAIEAMSPAKLQEMVQSSLAVNTDSAGGTSGVGQVASRLVKKAMDFIDAPPPRPTVRNNPPSLTTKPQAPKITNGKRGFAEVRKVQFPRVNPEDPSR